jgi:hypothetical protein
LVLLRSSSDWVFNRFPAFIGKPFARWDSRFTRLYTGEALSTAL